jgi:hypothetical protein
MTLPTIFERRLRRGVLGAVCESIAYLVVAAGTASVAPAEVGHTQAGRPFFGVMYQAAGNQELKIS